MKRLLRALRLLWLTVVLFVSKTLRLTYVLAITLLVVLGWLLFTTSGADWLAQRAMDEEPRLQLEITGGNLWSGLDVSDVSWRDEGIDVVLDRATLRWNLLCLHALRVCLQEVATEGARISIDTERLPLDEDPDPPEIDLPVTVLFPDVRADDVQLRVDGHRIRWASLSAGGSFAGSSLVLDRVSWAGLVAEPQLPAAEETPAAPPTGEGTPNIAELLNPDNRERIQLPDVDLPLNVAVREFLLRDARVMLPEREEVVHRLAVAAEAGGDRVRLHYLELEHDQLRLRANGSITLSGDYPLDMDVTTELRDIPDVGTVAMELQAWNSIADAELRFRLEGPATLTAEGRLSPLDPSLPAALQVDWRGAGWPLIGEQHYRSPEGSLRFQGDLHDYRFELAVLLDGRDIPDGRIRATGNADYASAELDQLLIEALEGRVESSGRVSWDGVIRWDARLAIDGINASSLHPEAPHRLDGRLSTSGVVDGDELTLDLAVDRLRAAVRDEILDLNGRIGHRPERGWLLQDVVLESGSSRMQVSGTVADRLDLRGDLSVAELADYLPDAGGSIEGTFRVQGPMETPDVRLSMEGRELRYLPAGTLEVFSLDADVRRLGEADSRVELSLSGFRAGEGDLEVGSLEAGLRGTRQAHTLELELREAPVEATLAVRGSLGEDFGWDGELSRAEMEGAGMGWMLDDPMPVRYSPDPLEVRLGAHCWHYETARLCAEEDIVAGASGSAALSLRGYRLDWLHPWLPDDIRLQGSILADVAAEWGNTPLPTVSLGLSVDDGSVLLLDPDDREEVLTLDYETLALRLRLQDELLDVGLDLVSSDLGQADVDATVVVESDGQLGALDGAVRISGIRLSLLGPFFPEIRDLQGELAAEAQLAGTVADPDINGQVSLQSGLVETVAVPVTISDINLTVDVAGSRATLSGGFRSGAGEAELGGEADWSGESWQLALGLTGSRLDVAYEDMVRLRVSPDLRLQVEPREVRLTGTLRVPEGEITIQQLPEGAVRVSRDVVIVDDEEEDTDELLSPDDIPTPEGWVVSTDVEVVLGNRVHLSGYGFTSRLEGSLRVRQEDGGVLQGNGEIRIEDGRYRAYGQRLTIRQGQFLFAGPIDAPEIYVEAIRTINRTERTGEQRTVIAGLRLEGRPEEPRVSLFSEPAMAEDDILSYIVLGRPVGESGPDGANIMARAALSLGIAGGGGFVTSVAEDLGVEDFQIDTAGEGEDTQFVVSGYLGPNLFVSYGVGVFQPTNEITLRYRLATNLFLQAVAGLESALDILYSFEF